jgi:hypothetical protein
LKWQDSPLWQFEAFYNELYTKNREKEEKKERLCQLLHLAKNLLPRVSLGYAPYLPHNIVT